MENIGHFNIQSLSGEARACKLHTAHGVIHTPVFMPVGTKATVKTMLPEELEDMGAEVILGNTYHLHLRPGEEIIHELGGLHQFMNWKKPILTDSGGFQVFSLSLLRKICEDGVEFRNHIDGKKCFLSPEKSIQIQMSLGADIIMAFDECPPFLATEGEVRKSMDLTHRWLVRSKQAMNRKESLLFGIIQGGVFSKLRKDSLNFQVDEDLSGYALGGLSVGEPISQMYDLVHEFAPQMPTKKPRYLMGVGTPVDLLTCIDAGIDMFDCVMPTRVARNGILFTSTGRLSIKKEEHKRSSLPVDEKCFCYTCQRYSRAYLRHLFLSGEILSSRLNTIHNLHFYLELMKGARRAILSGKWAAYKNLWLSRLAASQF